MEATKLHTTMKSKSVQETMKRLRINENESYHLYYDSGVEYLEFLKYKCKSKAFFDHQFGAHLTVIGRLSIRVVFEQMLYSVEFWNWWRNHLWCTCREIEITNKTELFYRLQFSSITIPSFVLKKIFYEKQEPITNQRISVCSKTTTKLFETEKNRVGSKIG